MNMRKGDALRQGERPGHALGATSGERRRLRTHARVRQAYGLADILGKGAE
jgi:hypothetical protein